MDVHCIEMLLDLPEFRLIGLTLGDHQIDLHLQRQEHAIICPRCQRVCERIKESRSPLHPRPADPGTSRDVVAAHETISV